MLIITADDYGKSRITTDNILKCFLNGRITSASAMVFMEDSERAASLALESKVEAGLHLNLTMPFNGNGVALRLRDHHNRVISYLGGHKLFQIIYNPFLRNSFDYVASAQWDEFTRIYGKTPAHYNGHHHMHLCANVLGSPVIPRGMRVRRTFAFDPGEKGTVNRMYRRLLNRLVCKRFIATDSFFSIEPIQNLNRLRGIIERACKETVEIEVHPENREEAEFLLSEQFGQIIADATCGNYEQAVK